MTLESQLSPPAPLCLTGHHKAAPQGGFTLIELMIVVAIIGILAAIAYPSYTKQVQRSRRSDAQTVLMEAAQWMQRKYVSQSTFGPAGAVDLPAGLEKAPRSGDAFYTIGAVSTDGGAGFLLTAAVVAGKEDADCGNLTLDHRGVKGSTTMVNDASECWK